MDRFGKTGVDLFYPLVVIPYIGANMKRLLILLLPLLVATACGGNDPQPSDLAAEASAIYDHADALLRSGDVAEAHAEMQRALDLYRTIPGSEKRQSLCLYQLAIEYFNQRDTSALAGILGQMKALVDANPSDKNIAYDYYSVLSSDYTARFEDNPDDLSLRDGLIETMKKAAFAMEGIPADEWKRYQIEPVWAWYNIAVSYDLYFDPPVTDSVSKYLEKAEQVRVYPGQTLQGEMETFISTEDLRAWLKYGQGDYAGAKASMDSVLAVIEKVEQTSPNTVITERGEAYAFYVEMYSSLGQYDKALEYQQLIEENNKKRYDVERLSELHDVSERYQNEKKQAEIERLQTLSRWRLGLILVLALLLGALVLAYLLYRRNAEQKLYEAALEAENRMAEADAANLLLEKLKADISSLPSTNPYREAALEALSKPGLQKQAELAFSSAEKPLSQMDRKYLYCFLAGLGTEQIGVLFNIETASVYTVRYRLRKKFPKGNPPV